MNIALANNKTSIARRFSHAAASYDSNALLQQQVAQTLNIWTQMSGSKVACALDIGCGTGQLHELHSQNATTWINLDISIGMLKHAKARSGAVHIPKQAKYNSNQAHYVCADAEALPLTNECMNLVCSSMALQWCDSPYSVLSEVYRVLARGGRAILAVMVSPSFSSLVSAWQELGQSPRVNTFASVEQWLQDAKNFNWTISSKQQTFHTEHRDLSEALKSIKGVGANTNNQASHQRAFSKREFKQLHDCFANKKSIQLDYQVCFIALQK
jgi:malonyl-CoA O-methyltransferase